jgi:hypothetical protein
MDTIKEAFLSPKEGLQTYAERIIKTISARSSLFNLTNDGIQTITSEPIDFLPVASNSERVSIILGEDSEIKARTSYRTTDILSMTAGYDNLRTVYETVAKDSGKTSGLSLSIETVSQQNPVRAVSLLTSDSRVCSDPPMYPEAVMTFVETVSPVITELIPEDERSKHIFHIMDIGVGNGEILAACATMPNCIYTGVDTRLSENFIERTTTDSPIRHDSRGLIDILSLASPDITRRCILLSEMPTNDEMKKSEKYDLLFIHVDYYTATRGNIEAYIPFVTDTGLIIVYGNPLRPEILKDLYSLGNKGDYGFWGMIGIQNIQRTVSPFLIMSKDGRVFDPASMDITIFLGRTYGNYIKTYSPKEKDGEESAPSGALKLESISYRKRSIPQLVGNLYKATKILHEGQQHIVKLEDGAGDADLEKYLNLFATSLDGEIQPSRAGVPMKAAKKSKPITTTLRVFSSKSGNPIEQVILHRNKPGIRIHHTRENDIKTALEKYEAYKLKYGAKDMDSFIPEILRGTIFKIIQKTLERSGSAAAAAASSGAGAASGAGAGAGAGRRPSTPAVIVYHRDNFITSVITSLLASLKVKIGIVFSFNSDSGVLGLDTIRRIPDGVSYFYKIQDAFSQFDENVAMIINLSSDIMPEEITVPTDSEKRSESSRATPSTVTRPIRYEAAAAVAAATEVASEVTEGAAAAAPVAAATVSPILES